MVRSDLERFEWLVEYVRETSLLETAMGVLEWDEQTGLPAKAGDYRASQLQVLSRLVHERKTNEKFFDELQGLVESDLVSDSHTDVGATILLMHQDITRERKLPTSLVTRLTRATSLGQQAWVQARADDDFASFLPHLQEIIGLRLEQADLLRTEGMSRYDVFLDHYEPGMTTKQVTSIFRSLREELVPLVAKSIANRKRGPNGKSLMGDFSVAKQKLFSRWAAESIGYSFERGRLDETEHPFCTSLGPHDHRILTRYFEGHVVSGFFSTLHEAGHAMYEQGLKPDWFGLPPGTAASLGVHESQSRLWENMVGRSESFWRWAFPELKKLFPVLDQTDFDSFLADVNFIEPSLVRVEADEVTYNLHIMIRFELELELTEGTLELNDLPDAWRHKYQSYLGIEVPNDREGVLQDVHWAAGLFGYFPTYTLGNIYAAQLMKGAKLALPDLDQQFTRGEFGPLLEWLGWNVHLYGRKLKPPALIRQAVGEEVSADSLVQYLREKVDRYYPST